MNRRRFLAGSGISLGAAALLPSVSVASAATSCSATIEAAEKRFPAGFRWGTATASYQVEGAATLDGRGPSIWDTFSHTPGKVLHGDTGDVADDFYHLYAKDIELMQELGIDSFRFSISWTRIFPQGSGQPNQAGVDFYRRLTDRLLQAGIEPFCTLYHWDLPQTLQDKGGWENRDTALRFAEYAGYTARQLEGRVKRYMTVNEMRSFIDLGYGMAMGAPGFKLPAGRLAQARHYALLAHGLGVQSIRANTAAGTHIGLADNVDATVPVIVSPKHIAAARTAFREQNAGYLTAIMEGSYTERYLKKLGPDAPHFTDAEMTVIHSPLDFVGVNIYTPLYVRADDGPDGYEIVQPNSSYPHMASEWLYIGPEALYWAPKLVAETWKVKALYVTENGASANDEMDKDGQVYDISRVMYLRNYLTQLHRAVAEGIPVKGYFLWSLLDNFEWLDGYGKRFGIVHVDYASEKRTPKLSAAFYSQVIRSGSVS